MKERPYHHLPDGTFRNPKGSPVIISRSGKFSYRTFSKLRKKVDLSYPKEHVIEKQKVLADLEKYKDNDYIAWIGHATYLKIRWNYNYNRSCIFKECWTTNLWSKKIY